MNIDDKYLAAVDNRISWATALFVLRGMIFLVVLGAIGALWGGG